MGCARACSATYLLEDEVSTFVALFALCRRLRPVIAKCPKRATPGLAWGLLVPIEAQKTKDIRWRRVDTVRVVLEGRHASEHCPTSKQSSFVVVSGWLENVDQKD
jgi:hypothetical protein